VEYLHPHSILAPSENNSREYPTTQDSLIGLAMSMLTDGQQEPVKVALLPDGAYSLIFGFRRWRAACMIHEEQLSPTPFLLQCIVVPHLSESSVISGVVENTQRVNLGPIDEAHAIRRLQAETPMRQKDIGYRMGLSQSEVSRRLKLLELPSPIRRKVNQGHIPVDAALRSLELPEGPKRDAAIQSLVSPAKRTTADPPAASGQDANRISEDAQVRNEPAAEAAEKPVKPRTVKQILLELESYATPEEGERNAVQTWVLTKFVAWIRNPKRRLEKVMAALEETI
jgi:ParB/RepB/Spo0J family partition protein